MTFNGVTVAEYTGVLKLAYEKGYGKALGLVTCNSNSCAFKAGVLVNSIAARRAAAVTFTTTIQATFAGHRPDAATVTSTVTPAALSTGITTIIATDSSAAGVTPPSVAVVAAATSHSVAPPPLSADEKNEKEDNGWIPFTAFIAGVTLVCVVGMILLALYKCYTHHQKKQGVVFVHESAGPPATIVQGAPVGTLYPGGLPSFPGVIPPPYEAEVEMAAVWPGATMPAAHNEVAQASPQPSPSRSLVPEKD